MLEESAEGSVTSDIGTVTGTDLDMIEPACQIALAGGASRVVSFDAAVVLEIVRRLRVLEEGAGAPADVAIKSFVSTRLESMASRPRSWAGTKEAFIVQLALLVEVSWIWALRSSVVDHRGRLDLMMSALCAAESGRSVPAANLLTVEWARERVDIARKHVAP